MPASTKKRSAKAIACGCSAGGVEAIRVLLGRLPADYRLPVFITLHRSESDSGHLIDLLNNISEITITSPDDKESIQANHAYLAPADYHMQIERDFTFSLSTDPPVNHCRPSIDVMFETAAWAYGRDLVGVVLTGANEDGSLGLKTISECGGLTIVESPETARFPMMPKGAIQATRVDHVLSLGEIVDYLVQLPENAR